MAMMASASLLEIMVAARPIHAAVFLPNGSDIIFFAGICDSSPLILSARQAVVTT